MCININTTNNNIINIYNINITSNAINTNIITNLNIHTTLKFQIFFNLLLSDDSKILLCDEKSRIFRKNKYSQDPLKICFDGSLYHDFLTGDCHPHG